MEIKIELDLPSIIAQAVSAERIQPIVDKAIDEAVKSAISSATGYSSPFRKALEEQLREAMPHGLALDDVAKFQNMLNSTMQKFVHDANNETITAAIDKAVKEVMPDVPATVKMSELIAMARGGFHKDEHEEFYAYFEPSTSGGGWLSLDSDPNPGSSSTFGGYKSREDRKYAASIRLAFTKEGEVYSLKLKGNQITPSSRPDIIGQFDATLMAMYVGRTRIEVDMDDDDVESAAGEQWD